MKLSRELLETIVTTANATSKDKVRYDLNSVYVTFSKAGQATVVATDGHILSETYVKSGNEVNGLESLGFNSEDIADLKALLKKDKYSNEFELKRLKHEVSGVDQLFLSSSSYGFTISGTDVNFPDYKTTISFIPQGPVTVLSFNVDYLKALADSLGKVDKRAKQIVTLVVGSDETAPIAVFRGNGEDKELQRAVIMPCRIDNKEELAARLNVQLVNTITQPVVKSKSRKVASK